jgi:SAM-dependent methyltransferase
MISSANSGRGVVPPWNHNTHYHELVLEAVPPQCRRALDVGCGTGLLARRLADRCADLVAIDCDAATIARAASAQGAEPRITFRHADFMALDFGDERFDFISAVATLHHLPLRPALARFRDLLAPGGVLAIVGLYRLYTPADYAIAGLATPASWTLQLLRGQMEVDAPLQDPKETLSEIRSACAQLLPGAELRRRLLFRYSLLWRKP